jgi:hypothetical protein
MKLLLTRYVITVLIIITVPLPLFLSCLPLLAPLAASTVSLCEFLCLQAHRETDLFFAAFGVDLAQTHQDLFHFRRTAFYSQLKSKVGNILAKATALRINLNIHGGPIASPHTLKPLSPYPLPSP